MKIVSINVGLPKQVEFRGQTVLTGIFKSQVAGMVAVGKTNLAGDGQADLTVHGGEDKAVYAYSLDHYAYWQRTLGRSEFAFGQFGENLTVEALREDESCIGDHLQIGTAQFAITQPRMPCFKLGVRFADEAMPKLFTKSGLSGFYLKVLREGALSAGDEIKLLQRGAGAVTVKELFRAYLAPADTDSRAIYRRVLEAEHLAQEWREKIALRVAR